MHEKQPVQYDEQRRARAGTSAVLRALVAGYLIYMAWQIVKNVHTGQTTMSPAVAYAAAGVFLTAALAFGVYLLRRWRKEVEAARISEAGEAMDTAEDGM